MKPRADTRAIIRYIHFIGWALWEVFLGSCTKCSGCCELDFSDRVPVRKYPTITGLVVNFLLRTLAGEWATQLPILLGIQFKEDNPCSFRSFKSVDLCALKNPSPFLILS